MQNQQMDSYDSTFKMPIAPAPPPSQAETLLFNDILEEKSVALRNNMMEFLQVLPYRKFDMEFSNFLKRTKCMILEGQRTGANISRLTNTSQIVPFNPRPSTSFHYRQSSSAMSMMSSHRNSTFRAPENSFQPVEPLNPFKPPANVHHIQPRVVLPRIEQSSQTSDRSHSLLATVIEVSHNSNLNRNTNNVHEPPELLKRPESPIPPPNGYSDVTMNEDELVSNSQQNDNIDDGSNSIESLLDSAGFKIVLGLPENNKITYNNVNQHNSQLNIEKKVEKFLSKWHVNAKVVKSTRLKSSKVIVLITGTLVAEDRATVLENHHDAGMLESRKNCDLIKTTNGFYRLIGNIIGGSPNELYQMCKALKGIPKLWRKSINELCGVVEKSTKNMDLDFSLDSPAGPIKLVKPKTVDMNISYTRNGKAYGNNIRISTQNSNGKRKSLEHNEFENKSKHRKFHAQVPPLTASTPKRPVKPSIYESPSQLLKKKMQNKTAARLTDLASNIINDSISVTKRRSLIKEQQSNELLKPKSTTGTSLLMTNQRRSNQESTTSCIANLSSTTKQSKQKTVNISNVLNSINNSRSANSSRKTADNFSTATFNSSKKLTTIVSKSNSNNSRMPKEISKDTSSSITKQAKQKENIANDISLSKSKPVNKKKNKSATKEVKKQVPVAVKEKSNKKVTKQKHTLQCSSDELGLFGQLDNANISDVDFNMESPGKLSVLSRGEKSRSETPPLFDKPWTTTAKSLTYSNPPTPLSKSIEAKALKRVKAPKITLEEELKNEKKINKKKACDYEAVNKQINKLLEYGENYDE